ncbi:MAG: peptidylprolyl isomerase [Methanomicrobiaceae archaeon]|nr:peptidylprolyl isomerase [Methanomicrobiaceae archaeon]
MNKKYLSLITLFTALALFLACGCTGSSAQTAETGDTVYIQYKGTYNNGTVFDESDPGDPIVFTLGQNSMIKGFEDAVYGMKVGDKKNIHLSPEEAYGNFNPDYVFNISRDMIPEDVEIYEGAQLIMSGVQGDVYSVVITGITNDTVEIDANHPMAGKELNFEINLVNIE